MLSHGLWLKPIRDAIKDGLLNIYGETVQYQYLNVFFCILTQKEFVQVPFYGPETVK